MIQKTFLKNKIGISFTLGLLALGCFANKTYGEDIPEIRSLNIDPISISDDSLIEPQENENTQQNISQGNSEIHATMGKSQMIKFDEPVKRISIAKPEMADLVLISPKEMLINGKSCGETSLIVWGEAEEPLFFDLVIKQDSKAFLNAINNITPNEEINLNFTPKGVVLSGQVSTSYVKNRILELGKAHGFEIIDLAESPASQVQISVRIVEASKSVTNQIGSTFSKGDLSNTALETLGVTNKNDSLFDFDGTLNGFRFIKFFDNDNIASVLRVAEQNGNAKTLAEPTLLAANQKEAEFNAGQEVPVPSSVGEGGNVGYEYKKIGVNVSFTPTILEDSKRIQLEIKPEVSEIDSSSTIQQQGGGTAYGFKTRSVDTTVELADGETLIIAGLYKTSNQQTNTLVPIIGNIPIIGRLFGNDSKRKDETDLMIFVTPTIINNEETNIDRI